MFRFKIIYHLLLIAGLLMINVQSRAGQSVYPELPDSVRTLIRLRSHLLISMKDFPSGELDSLVGLNIPLAFYEQDFTGKDHLQWFQKLSARQDLIPVLTRVDQAKSLSTPLVLITYNDLDHAPLSLAIGDSLFTDSLFTFRELLHTDPSGRSDLQLFYRIWLQSGKVPNLIPATRSDYKELARVAEQLNATQKIFGVVRSDKGLLPRVSWKGYPHSKTNGYFCFPLLPGKALPFMPYKPGYRFSPDIIYDSPGNRGFWKEFTALSLSSDFELTDHFVFGKRIMNLQRKNDPEFISHGVKAVRDEKRGDCALFPGRAYLDAGTQSIGTLKPNFTVTAWIKPTQLDDNNSILGKGTYFVLKLHDGLLTYTMQGIKDYISLRSPVPLNRWTFISLVHSAYENRMRFYINGKLTDQTDLISAYRESDHSLLIGSNLWEEFFVGAIGEIKIWQRELNEDEIHQQYLGSSGGKPKPLPSLVIWLLIPAGLLLFRIFFRKKNRFSPEKKPLHLQEPDHDHLVAAACERILCFGGLRVINHQDIDVSRKFSPKLKQLFILIFMHSMDGQKGITTKKLSEILWPGMSPQHAKNTRGTNIQNLKALLASCTSIRLAFRDKLWFLELDPSCYCDYADAQERMASLEKRPKDAPIPAEELKTLLKILSNGTLFPNMSESWLDPYVSKTSDRIVELGLHFLDRLDEIKHASLVYELADVVSIHDPLNEPALNKKLSLLTLQGKLSLAHTVYDHFARLYQELYQEPYPHDFRSINQTDA
ncbi:MAG: LamG-like jellyroll fold domain-containing protein [Prolixibacteraceae bacterium]